MNQPLVYTFNAMTTTCNVTCFGLKPKVFAKLSQQIAQRVDALVTKYNFHSADSWLNQVINRREHDRVAVDQELASILSTVKKHSAFAGDLFDITIGTCSSRLKAAKTFADVRAIKEACQPWMGAGRWQLTGRHVEFDNPHTHFDLGGVIKEYAVDLCVNLAQQAGATAALVNFGGDIRCFGRKPDGSRFVAAVSDPLRPSQVLFGLDLENQALTTSGHYARKRTLEDGDLSHVQSVHAFGSDWLSASVVSHSALVSGIYSTSLLLHSAAPLPEQVFAVVVDQNKQLHCLEPKAGPATPHLNAQERFA